MAESLNIVAKKRMIQRLGFVLSTLLLLSTFSFASAQSLRDPTRPPASLGQAEHPEAGAAGPVLQSVLVSPERKIAIISGQTVKLGGKFGDAKVIRITESEVVLSNGSHVQTLKLFPALEKQSGSHRPRPKADVQRQ
jgi:MSHA biogenesis protein MshK